MPNDNEPTEVTVEMIDAKLLAAFQTLYPIVEPDGFNIVHNDDETIDVIVEDSLVFKADIFSDDDGYLRFRPYDPDFEAEYPDEDPYQVVSIRVEVYA